MYLIFCALNAEQYTSWAFTSITYLDNTQTLGSSMKCLAKALLQLFCCPLPAWPVSLHALFFFYNCTAPSHLTAGARSLLSHPFLLLPKGSTGTLEDDGSLINTAGKQRKENGDSQWKVVSLHSGLERPHPTQKDFLYSLASQQQEEYLLWYEKFQSKPWHCHLQLAIQSFIFIIYCLGVMDSFHINWRKNIHKCFCNTKFYQCKLKITHS